MATALTVSFYKNDKIVLTQVDSITITSERGGEDGVGVLLKLEGDASSEVLATGSATLAGASGSIDSIEVNGVEVMSGAENFDTDTTDTATAVAANITAHTSAPNYTATSALAVVTITAVAGTGADPNGFQVVTTGTTMTSTDTEMSGGSEESTLAFGSNFESLDSVAFDNTKMNHIYMIYDTDGNGTLPKIFYSIKQTAL